MNKQSLFRAVLFLSIFLGAFVVYWPGLQGPFLFDDYPNLEPMGYFGGVNDAESARKFVFGNGSGPTGRPISMASFLLNDNAWPSDPWKFKLTNLLFHMLSGIVLFLVLRKLFRTFESFSENHVFWFSITVTAFWVLHPINVSTVLYVIQRMAILSTLFVLISLYFYLAARESLSKGRGKVVVYALFSLLFMLVGAFSKENALLIVPFVLLLEGFWFRRPNDYLGDRFGWGVFAGVVLLIFMVLYFSYPIWGAGYVYREFTVWERLFYQVSAIGDYSLKIIVPNISDLNLFRGYYESAGKIEFSSHVVVTYLVTLSLIAALVISFIKKYNVQVLGLVWFFSFHLMESTVLPLELYFEHRNYLPSIGLIICFIGFLNYLRPKLESRLLASVVPIGFLIFFIFNTLLLSSTWARGGTLLLKWEMDEPLSARAKVFYGEYLENMGFPQNTVEHLDRALALNPNSLGLSLKKLNAICDTDLDIDVKKVVSTLQNANNFDFGAGEEIRSLAKSSGYNGSIQCANQELSLDMDDIFRIAEGAGVATGSPKRAAQYYSTKSDYYAGRGNLNEAVSAIEEAIIYQPSVDLYLKGAVMLASAGLYKDALEKIEYAKEADHRRQLFYPSRMEELLNLEEKVKALDAMGKNV